MEDINLVSIIEYCILLMIITISLVSDIKYRKVNDTLILVGIVVWLGIIISTGFQRDNIMFSLEGGLGICIPLIVIIMFAEKVFKKPVMGGGDVKLLFLCGIYLGIDRTINVLFIALISMLLIAVPDIIKRRNKVYAFVPSIAIGVVLAVLLPAAIKVYNLPCQI